jgi:hypothetical protein
MEIPPEAASEQEVDHFLAGLRADARAHVRELMLQGAGEAEIAEYVAGLDRSPEEIAQDDLEAATEEESQPF